MALATLTPKGQVTLPKQVRETLKLYTGDKIEIIVTKNREALIRPISKKVDDIFSALLLNSCQKNKKPGKGKCVAGIARFSKLYEPARKFVSVESMRDRAKLGVSPNKGTKIMIKSFTLNRIFSKTIAGSLILFIGLFCGCVSNTSTKENNAQEFPNLKDITLSITDLAGKSAKLKNGTFKGDHLLIHVLYEAVADFNNDGLIDGVIIIFENSGGSGNFRELCLMFNNGDKLVQADQAFIGDRIKITSLNIDGNIITIDYMDRGENDAYSIDPYIKKRVRYRVQEVQLKQLSVKD